MARTSTHSSELDTPKRLFACQIKVRIDDINYGNHVGNDKLLAYMHEARTQWLAHHGLSEANVTGLNATGFNITKLNTPGIKDNNTDNTCGLIMLGAAIDYLHQAYLHQPLNITLSLITPLHKPSTSRFTLGYVIEDSQRKTTIAKGETDLCCFNYHQQKATRMPHTLRQLLT